MPFNKEKLKARRLQLGLTLQEVADELEVSKPTIQRYESGRIKKIETATVEKLSQILHCTPAFLLDWEDLKKEIPRIVNDNEEIIALYNQLDDGDKKEVRGEIKGMLKNDKYKHINIAETPKEEPTNIVEIHQDDYEEEYEEDRYIELNLYDIGVSAGTGSFLGDDAYFEKINIDKELNPDSIRCDFVLRIIGDSMQPYYLDDDIVFIKEQQTIENGQVGIFVLDGEAYIKKFVKDDDGMFLVSYNEKYEPIKIHEYSEFRCVGRVLSTCETCK